MQHNSTRKSSFGLQFVKFDAPLTSIHENGKFAFHLGWRVKVSWCAVQICFIQHRQIDEMCQNFARSLQKTFHRPLRKLTGKLHKMFGEICIAMDSKFAYNVKRLRICRCRSSSLDRYVHCKQIRLCHVWRFITSEADGWSGNRISVCSISWRGWSRSFWSGLTWCTLHPACNRFRWTFLLNILESIGWNAFRAKPAWSLVMDCEWCV